MRVHLPTATYTHSPSCCEAGRGLGRDRPLISNPSRSPLSEAVGKGPQFLNHFSLCLCLPLCLCLSLVTHLELNPREALAGMSRFHHKVILCLENHPSSTESWYSVMSAVAMTKCRPGVTKSPGISRKCEMLGAISYF